MKTIVYSSIYGGYDTPIKQIIKEKPILFTDQLTVDGWSAKMKRVHKKNDRMRAKYFKCNPHKELDCDISIWIDGSGTIRDKNFVKRCIEYLGDADMLAFKHPDRDCIYDEAEFCEMFEKYRHVDIMGQVREYKNMGWPEHTGLWACGLLVRRHNNRTKRFNKLWWEHINKYTYQDQLSFPVCTWLSGVKLKTLELELNDNNLITFLTPHASLK